MTNKITHVLFDFDGTLLNTNELIIATFQHVLDRHFPGKYNEESILPFLGPPLIDTFTKVLPEKAEQLTAEYREWNVAHHDSYARPFPGVKEMLYALKERGIHMALVSTKRRDVIEQGIRLLDLRDDLFEALVAIDDVKNAKPDPEPLQLAMERIGANPETTIMVGDNHHDIEGGHNAGVRTVAVSWSAKGIDFLKQFHPTYIADTMEDIVRIVDEANR